MVYNGSVKWFSKEKGYGFVIPDTGEKDVFVHITAVQSSGLTAEAMKDRTPISYELKEHKGKMAAVNLKLG